jgi:hypothetical protein
LKMWILKVKKADNCMDFAHHHHHHAAFSKNVFSKSQ